MRLLLDRLLVRRSPLTSEGGIVIPEKAGEKSDRGVVLYVGPGRKDATMVVKVGDEVIFDKHAGQVVKLDGEELLSLYEAEVIGIL
jgi:chaperonin GroES